MLPLIWHMQSDKNFLHESTSISTVQRTTLICMVVNTLLALLKFAGGILGHSQAIVADAVHTLSDSVTDVTILVGVRYWSKPPDGSHQYGHRRLETAITALIALVLLAVAIGLTWNALITLREMHECPPGLIALAAALVSIVSKELLYRWSVNIGKRIKSSAVVANAWHHRSDALSSIPAALAVAGAAVSPRWWFLDHLGAVVVSLFILKAAWDIGWPALGELLDRGAPHKQVQLIHQLAMQVAGVKEVHGIRTRYTGSGVQLDLHIMVNPLLSVREGHDIARAVKQAILADGPNVIDAVIHIEPYEAE